jgi:hypothetical protein
MSGAAPTAPRTPTRNDGSGDNDVEEVQVQAVAVDPGGETREAEQPAGGYPSDAEEDALPAELVAEDATVDAAEDDENEPPLEDAEAAVGDDCCVSVFGTAASMTAAADAAIAAHRADKGYERPNATQKKEETKVASEARKTWVEAQWLEPHTAADSEAPLQCRNADALAQKNVLPGDGKITFVEDGHKYTAYGEAVHRSTTGVMADFFEKFDPIANTDEWYESWKGNRKHKYYPIIKETLDGGGSDDDAKAAIRKSWETLGAEASRLGTALHLHCEYALNEQSLPRDSDIETEIVQFESFLASPLARQLELRPVRTELCVAYRLGGRVVSAGQIDALFIDKNGLYYIVDFKRVAKHHKLDPKEKGFTPDRATIPPRTGLGALSHLPDTHFQKYSLQTSVYNLMLLDTHNIDVADRMYLLRCHSDRAAYELVKCGDLRAEAKKILEIESQQLPPLAPVTTAATIEPPAYVPPVAPRRKKLGADGNETEELEVADPVKDFEAAYKRKVGTGGPSLAILKKMTSKSGAFAFWSLFFSAGLLAVMTKNTNQYATSVGAGADYYEDFNGNPFKQVELEKCFGLLYRNGLWPVPDLDLMFADPRNRFTYGDMRVRDILGPNSIRRFKQFRALFHIQHPTESRFVRFNMETQQYVPATAASLGPFAKLEPLLGSLMHACMTCWVVGCTLAFDEITIGFTGRHYLAQRIKYKKEGDGFLFDSICDDGYLWCWWPRHVAVPNPPEPSASPLHNRCLYMIGLLIKYSPAGATWWSAFFDNLFTSFAFIVWCAKRKVKCCGVARKGGRGIPAKVLQKEVTKSQLEKVKGTLKVAVRNIKVGTTMMLVLAASVYDTKPVNMLTSVHVAATLDDQMRKVWSRSRGVKEDIAFKRLNIIHDYNQHMNQVDRQDHLRGNYRPDTVMRCRKWWWPIFLFAMGAGATNAYLVYRSVCAAEGIAKEKIMSHRAFLEELCDQLCHPELRTPKQPEREMERESPARQKRKEREQESGSGSSTKEKAGKLTWARVNRARAGFDANQHTFTDPIWRGAEQTEKKHRADCQWCKFKWIEAGRPRPEGCKATKFEGPQNKEVMYCTRCGVHFCSASCWNEFHGC